MWKVNIFNFSYTCMSENRTLLFLDLQYFEVLKQKILTTTTFPLFQITKLKYSRQLTNICQKPNARMNKIIPSGTECLDSPTVIFNISPLAFTELCSLRAPC